MKDKLLADVTDSKKKRLNVVVDEDLYQQIKVRSVLEKRTITDITIELWKSYLKSKIITQHRNP